MSGENLSYQKSEPGLTKKGRFNLVPLPPADVDDAVETFESDSPEAETKAEAETVPDRRLGKFPVKAFNEDLLPGETVAARKARYEAAQERKMAVAFSEGPEALLAPDFDFNGSSETERADLTATVRDRYLWIGKMDNDKFLEETGRVVRHIETPMSLDGAEVVYDRLKTDNFALHTIYALTAGEAWTPEEAPADLDEAGQKQLGTRVLGAFFGKYATAADFRKAKASFLEAVKTSPEYQDALKTGELDRSLDNLAWEVYGLQEEWTEVAESVRETGQKFLALEAKRAALDAEEKSLLESVSGLSDPERLSALETSTKNRVKPELSTAPEKPAKAEPKTESGPKTETKPKPGFSAAYRKAKTARRDKYNRNKDDKAPSIFTSDLSAEDNARVLREMGLM